VSAALSFIALVETTLLPSLRHRLPFDGPLQKNKFVRHHKVSQSAPASGDRAAASRLSNPISNTAKPVSLLNR
jgi:hypothetical protein